MKLEFGCGDNKPSSGFLGVDIRPAQYVEFVCNAWDIDQHVPVSSVTDIYSRHFFEHLTYPQAEKTLSVWLKILKPGGRMQMIVPNMEYHISQWLDPQRRTKKVPGSSGLTLEQHAIRGFWGHQREGFDRVWDVHKSGYDWFLLLDTLNLAGFVNVEKIQDLPKNLNVMAEKPA